MMVGCMCEEYQVFLKDKGVPLKRVGTDEIALERDDTLNAIGILQKLSVPVLGGDVYLRRGSQIEVAYANWHVEPHQLANSWEISSEYVQKFPARADVTPLFVLVPRE
jgi:hypothetical protein